uniref:Serine palmitoyltransferase small subunit B n=1 Tax=Phlebotomus kandelakii TaxID=1109342 RepID=A0A6B2EFI9_9DIPT
MINKIKKCLEKYYYQYTLATCISILEPWERKFVNTLVVIILVLLTFSSFFYLPEYTERLLKVFTPSETVGIQSVSAEQI